jgi:hypothetical protein
MISQSKAASINKVFLQHMAAQYFRGGFCLRATRFKALFNLRIGNEDEIANNVIGGANDICFGTFVEIL